VNGAAAVNVNTYLNAAPVAVGTLSTGGTVTAGFNEILAKANWNAVLVEADASRGVHNPSFSTNVLNTTITRVRAL
jgi:hypothetical protein